MPAKGTLEEGYLEDLLVGHQLFFQSAPKLNDPYDCLPALFADFTPARAKALFERALRKEEPGLSDAACAAEVRRRIEVFDFESVKTPAFQENAIDIFKACREDMAVYCLTARAD